MKHKETIFRPDPLVAYQYVGSHSRLKRETRIEDGDAHLLMELEWRSLANPKSTLPQIAIWAESQFGEMIETFYLSPDSAFSEYPGWANGALSRSEILPVWGQRFEKASTDDPDDVSAGDPAVDAMSGPTRSSGIAIESVMQGNSDPFYLYVEVNAAGDENEFYHSGQPVDHPGHTRGGEGQPSVVYGAFVDQTEGRHHLLFSLLGQGGVSGHATGEILFDTDHLTTAKELVEKIVVRIQYH